MKYFHFIFACAILLSCSNPSIEPKVVDEQEPEKTWWRMEISLSDSVDLPIILSSEPGELNFTIHNASEQIQLKNIRQVGDSIYMEMPVFQSGFEGIIGENAMSGELVKYDAENYRLPFKAEKNVSERFKIQNLPCCKLAKKYKVTFRPDLENAYNAIGEFTLEGNKVTGSFLTETGDARFLEGVLDGNTLKLSAFDGNHLYRYDAFLADNGTMKGIFFSGRSRADKWIAEPNDTFELADPESLTYLKDGETEITFSFPTTSNEIIDFNKEAYSGKAVVLQILGSWCPNCMDESRYLQERYTKYHEQGLEVIGLAFERKRDQNISFKAIDKMVEDLGITYPVVFAGSTKIEDREKALPQLNKIMSFPTSIYINKKGEVVKIHTGFAGQGTSEYDNFVKETDGLIETLLSE
ncbi:MAG: TlpA family protein disulfide reductase [Schleiferiaceae bacterium]|jgi:thiol-disulfide isomerase/thioredoxin|nr:TlpA family protein disulfide reductase [Schleiferiaceae bacterium]